MLRTVYHQNASDKKTASFRCRFFILALSSFLFGLPFFVNQAFAAIAFVKTIGTAQTYANGSPVSLIDPEGLRADPQSPGCDYVWPETKCMTACCNVHDDCYKHAYLNFCDATSWLEVWFRFGSNANRTRVDCQRCNSEVKDCIICCLTGLGGRKDGC